MGDPKTCAKSIPKGIQNDSKWDTKSAEKPAENDAGTSSEKLSRKWSWLVSAGLGLVSAGPGPADHLGLGLATRLVTQKGQREPKGDALGKNKWHACLGK